MTRCNNTFLPARRWYAGALLAIAACASLGASAQGLASDETRNFPPQAQFGTLAVTQFPTVEVDGKAVRTSPGFRLFSPERTLVQASTYQGQKLTVAYLIEPQTQWLHQAWILTPAEIAKHRKPGLLESLFGG
ncbi:hypothetical protein [Delftia sp. PS-11]|uniref:hypothetical protein n=1 Tax=Delftia sp. PS-11 TaxID=2767222 RepID=UPI0024541703|nr:hypothetical protein [Delftia sp. PS-11]KAJ8746372.1 hypothetical protein H9T68_01850 [Delftia sp. PS-11]